MLVRLKFPMCGHVRDYEGRLVLATCPNCGKKVRVEKRRMEQAFMISIRPKASGGTR